MAKGKYKRARSSKAKVCRVDAGSMTSRALVKPSRSIPSKTALFLYVQAGGRCEFDGCNKYLLEHGVTHTPGNFAEKAHIWAFSEQGPRGRTTGRPRDINQLTNLMLLCKECHTEVDTERPDDFPVDVLRKFKSDHEARVYRLTGLSKDRDTVAVVMKAQIAGRSMDISDDEMQSAVAPNYLRTREIVEIDLTKLPDRADTTYWRAACSAIDADIDRLKNTKPRENRTLRLSVFALGPIPLLIFLGSKLNDKQDVDIYQRHRLPETWTWNEGPGDARFVTRQLTNEGEKVALLVNVSGTNSAEFVAKSMGPSKVYELTLDGQLPSLSVLRTRADLDRFTAAYMHALTTIRANHPTLEKLHLFPAVPAPVAIVMGRNRLPKVDPPLLVYDRDQRAGGFVATIQVGTKAPEVAA